MSKPRALGDVPLPRDWPDHVRSAVLHVIALAHTAITWTRSWAVSSPIARVRLAGQIDRAKNEIALLREEIRIKDARMRRIEPRHRPFYSATERMAILELRAARSWSRAQVAQAFLVEAETISSWMRRIDEGGKHALVRLPEAVNRFPDYVRHIVRRLKVLCPTMGKKRIAETLARAGLHLGVTTVGRMLKAKLPEPPEHIEDSATGEAYEDEQTLRVVTAEYPEHVWHVDLTVIPTSPGLWTPWMPFTLPQVWPFCWWTALVLDHFSRCVVGFAVFTKQPSSVEVRSLLGRAIGKAGKSPRYVISDKGPQFWCDAFKKWCSHKRIKPRFGAVGKHGSIALIERFIRSMKSEGLRIVPIPIQLRKMRTELSLYVAWYNGHRPHQALNGRTPDELRHGAAPSNRRRRNEPRKRWPTESRCAAPQANIKGRKGVRLGLRVGFLEGRGHLPIVELRNAA